MVAVNIPAFRGAVPRISERLQQRATAAAELRRSRPELQDHLGQAGAAVRPPVRHEHPAPPLPQTVEFTLYVDGQPVYSKQVTSSVPFRLPGNYLSEIFRVGLSASIPVYSFAMAQTVKELSELPQ